MLSHALFWVMTQPQFLKGKIRKYKSGLAKTSTKQMDLIQEIFSGLVERLELVKFKHYG